MQTMAMACNGESTCMEMKAWDFRIIPKSKLSNIVKISNKLKMHAESSVIEAIDKQLIII